MTIMAKSLINNQKQNRGGNLYYIGFLFSFDQFELEISDDDEHGDYKMCFKYVNFEL